MEQKKEICGGGVGGGAGRETGSPCERARKRHTHTHTRRSPSVWRGKMEASHAG